MNIKKVMGSYLLHCCFYATVLNIVQNRVIEENSVLRDDAYTLRGGRMRYYHISFVTRVVTLNWNSLKTRLNALDGLHCIDESSIPV